MLCNITKYGKRWCDTFNRGSTLCRLVILYDIVTNRECIHLEVMPKCEGGFNPEPRVANFRVLWPSCKTDV